MHHIDMALHHTPAPHTTSAKGVATMATTTTPSNHEMRTYWVRARVSIADVARHFDVSVGTAMAACNEAGVTR